MKHTLSYNELLNKLPIASTQFLDPLAYHLLNSIIRYGYRIDKPFTLTDDMLRYGVVGFSLPLMIFNNKPCSSVTIRKHRRVLQKLGVISYETRSYKRGFIGLYTINKQKLCELVSVNYAKAVSIGALASIFTAEDHVSKDNRRRINRVLRFTATKSTDNPTLIALSPIFSYVYYLVLSMATAVSSYTLKNLPKTLIKILNTSKPSIYRALSSLKGLINYDSSCKVYSIAVSNSAVSTTRTRSEVLV